MGMSEIIKMNNYRIVFKWFFTGTFIIFFLGGCALWDKYFGSEEEEELPTELMQEGTKNLEKGHYSAAIEAFEKLKDRYPYSKFAIEAELNLADSLYNSKRYEEAYDTYNDFERLHPKNPKIPYVMYQKGMSQFQQTSTIDRDQSHTYRAKEDFERLVKRFPKSEYATMARTKIRECYINLAEYELYVGHYYYKIKKYRAAMGRYRYLVENYPDLGQYHEALEYFSKCKELLSEETEEQEEPKRKKRSSWLKKLNPFNWWD
jgi:outer membrane protein assembly factor BamD